MPVCITLYKNTSVNLEQNFNFFFFSIRDKACSHVYVLPPTLAEFRANLCNLENPDTSKE